MRCALSTSAAVAILVAATVAVGDELPDLARGAGLYSANCGRCHNPRGPGEYSDREWPIVVTHMRVIAGLPGDQARSIEAFLRAANNPPPAKRRPPAQPAQPAKSGEDLIDLYGCRGCHKIQGSGGAIGPGLDDLFERRSESWVRSQIRFPREHNDKTVMPQYGLTEEQVARIVRALRAFAASPK